MTRYTIPTLAVELTALLHHLVAINRSVSFLNGSTVVHSSPDLIDILLEPDEHIGTEYVHTDLFDIDYENLMDDPATNGVNFMDSMLGFQPFGAVMCYGALIGQDYGEPVYVVFYRDEAHNLRAYVPKNGNAINPQSNKPFGEDDVADDAIAVHLGYPDYASVPSLTDPKIAAMFFDKQALVDDITAAIQLYHPPVGG